ncbi:hypothetical protein V8E54_000329 [Elaphomyces granulatus]|jgi:hypothetical protein
MAQQEQRFEGLQWVKGSIFDLTPQVAQWTIEPNLESMKCMIEEDRLSQGQEVAVSFLANCKGLLNKIYNVQVGSQTFTMRVSLPFDPQYKTLSEVATVDWMRRFTSLPVPKIISYSANRDNLLGFEWILMEKMPGKPLTDAWKSMQFSAKVQLVRKLAAYSSCLFKNQLRGIGNIYPDSSILPHSPIVQRICSPRFFVGDSILRDLPRGPFCSSKDWIFSHLSFIEHDCNSFDSEDSDSEDAKTTLQLIGRLKSHVSKFFPDCNQDLEPSMLDHGALIMDDILVDDNGILTGVVQWECASALPLWKACDFPEFLSDRPRYKELSPEDLNVSPEVYDYVYKEHLQYELTKLRQYFLDEMQQLEPKWIEVFESATAKRDFYFAVQHCDGFLAGHINRWLEDVSGRKGPVRSLLARVYDYC